MADVRRGEIPAQDKHSNLDNLHVFQVGTFAVRGDFSPAHNKRYVAWKSCMLIFLLYVGIVDKQRDVLDCSVFTGGFSGVELN